MFQRILPYLIIVPLLLGLGYWWVNSQLTNDGQKFQSFVEEVQTKFPSLKAEIHESTGYFPCLFGNYQGLEVHLHHEYRNRGSRRGYVFIKIWQKSGQEPAPLAVTTTSNGLRVKEGKLSSEQQAALEALDIRGWTLTIKGQELLFEEIPYRNNYSAELVQEVQKAIELCIDIYQTALKQ